MRTQSLQKKLLLCIVAAVIALLSLSPVMAMVGDSVAFATDAKPTAAYEFTVGIPEDCELYYYDEAGEINGYLVDYFKRLAPYCALIGSFGGTVNFNFIVDDRPSIEAALSTPNVQLTLSQAGVNVAPQIGIYNSYYSDNFLGYWQSALFVKSDNDTYSYEDYSAFSADAAMKVGTLANSDSHRLLATFAAERGFDCNETVYDTEQDLKSALESGAVDAVFESMYNNTFSKYVALGDISPIRVCGINSDYVSQLSAAMEYLTRADKNIIGHLYDDYYGSLVQYAAFTADEKQFITDNASTTFKVVGDPSNNPYEYFADGKYQGIYADFVALIAAKTGLNLAYVESADYADSLDKVSCGDADIISNVYPINDMAAAYDMSFTDTYAERSIIVLGKGGTVVADSADVTVVLDSGYDDLYYYVKTNFPSWKIRYASGVTACADMIINGGADLTLFDQKAAVNYLSTTEKTPISVVGSLNTKMSVAMGVSAASDARLKSLLSKAINSVTATEYDTIAAKYDPEYKYLKPTFEEIINKYRWYIIGGGVAIGLLIIAIIAINARRVYMVAYFHKGSGLHNDLYFLKHIESYYSQHKHIMFIQMNLVRHQLYRERKSEISMDIFMREAVKKFEEVYGKSSMIIHRSTDTYMIAMPYQEKEQAKKVPNLIRKLFDAQKDSLTHYFIGMNMGICFAEDTKTEPFTVYEMAVIANERANKRGLEETVFFDKEIEMQLERAKEIERVFPEALKNRDFLVYYQPKVDMRTNRIIGAEALARWRRGGEILSPFKFIEHLEAQGNILELDYYVLDEACAFMRRWHDSSGKWVEISVNQSKKHFFDENYFERTTGIIKKHDIPFQHVEFEILESIFVDSEQIRPSLDKLKALGFKLSIDDFGSGYSSLMMLRELPFDVLKIDRGFLKQTVLDIRSQQVLGSIVDLAHLLGMEVVCEGVETEKQIEFLRKINCGFGQGFYYSPPVPEAEFLKMLKEERRIWGSRE